MRIYDVGAVDKPQLRLKKSFLDACWRRLAESNGRITSSSNQLTKLLQTPMPRKVAEGRWWCELAAG
jgi:hypothetical protein